jgi:hypothetical protein
LGVAGDALKRPENPVKRPENLVKDPETYDTSMILL